MNVVMNECFVRAKILRFVWWWFGCERERVVLGFGFQCFQRVCERKMARERIIKNGKRMNILLNKSVAIVIMRNSCVVFDQYSETKFFPYSI